MEPPDIIDYLKDIPFGVASIAERCTEPGSYNRELANRVSSSIRHDIEKAIQMLKDERAREKRPC